MKQTVFVATNRNVLEDSRLHFGDKFNRMGPAELRFLTATKTGTEDKDWSITPLEEPKELSLAKDNLPSRKFFDSIISDIKSGDFPTKWLVHIHGFTQDFVESLNEAHRIQHAYPDINLILFSWPADPGGFRWSQIKDKFRYAQFAAEMSAFGFHRFLERLDKYFITPCLSSRNENLKAVTISLNAHSLGNHIVKHLPSAEDALYRRRLFANIILHQAAVSVKRHHEWIEDLKDTAKRAYITINAWDYALKGSFNTAEILDFNFSSSARALGSSRSGLVSAWPKYIDFTGGKDVELTHNIFMGDKFGNPQDNKIIKLFCMRLFRGEDGLVNQEGLPDLAGANGFTYEQNWNAWRIV